MIAKTLPNRPVGVICLITIILLLHTANTATAQLFVPVLKINPASGNVGTEIKITGALFGTLARSIVRFGGVTAKITKITLDEVIVKVPAGAAYGPVVYTNTEGFTYYSPMPFVPTFDNGGNNSVAHPAFTTKLVVPNGAGTNLLNPCIADLDGDGKPDVVVANYSTNDIAVYRNNTRNGVVAFAEKHLLTTGTSPYWVTAADLDHDGKPDLIVANRNSDNLSVFKNESTPGILRFKPVTATHGFTTGKYPISVAVTDVNQDGKPDIVVANYGGHSITVFRHTGQAMAFAAGVNFGTGEHPFQVAVADLNGDNKPDVATVNVTGTVSVLKNSGNSPNIGFDGPRNFTAGNYPQSFAIGDLNEDGKPDIVVANNFSHNLSVLENNGSHDMGFTNKATLNTAAHPNNVYIADINGDGKPDILVAGANDSRVLIYPNASVNKEFSVGPNAFYNAGSFVSSLAVADLDGDGKPDMAVVDERNQSWSVLKNQINSPIITSFTPASSTFGANVTISGSGFTGVNRVTLGDTPVHSFNVLSDNTIEAVTGASSSGNVAVSAPHGSNFLPGYEYRGYCAAGTSGPNNRGYLGGMVLNGVANHGASGPTGYGNFLNSARVTLTLGYKTNNMVVNLSTATGQVLLYIDYNRDGDFDDAGELVYASFRNDPKLVHDIGFTIPPTAIQGLTAARVRLVTGSSVSPCGIATNQIGETKDYAVILPQIPPPQIQSFYPSAAGPGDTVTITGANLLGATKVGFGGAKPLEYTVNSSTEIKAIIGAGATGDVLVTTPSGGTATLPGFTFIHRVARIKSFTPARAGNNQTIAIHGIDFNNTSGVSFGGTPAASFKVLSGTEIVAVTAAGSSGYVSITTPLRKDSLEGFTYLNYCVGGSAYNLQGIVRKVTIGGNEYPWKARFYWSYADQAARLAMGDNTIIITVIGATSFYYFGAYIDYNQDGEFGPGEELYNGRLISASTNYNFNFNVPASALPGATRLRLRFYSNDRGILGSCGGSSYEGQIQDYTVIIPNHTNFTGLAAITEDAVKNAGTLNGFTVIAAPNPTKTNFTLLINGDNSTPVALKVTDMYGRVVHQAKGAANQRYVFGENFAAGMYIAEVMQGKNIKTLKLVKGR